MIVNKLAI